MRYFKYFLLSLLLCALSPLYSWDGGVLTNQTPLYEDNGQEGNFSYSASILPWISIPLSKDSGLYFSAAFTLKWDDDDFSYIPELYRFEYDLRPAIGTDLKLGRVQYSDTFGYIAEGLFDGVSFKVERGDISFSAGAYYTGFLYKETAYITMTTDERNLYDRAIDYGDFDTYFAPKRALFSLNLDINNEKGLFAIGLLAQQDLRGEATALNSQYLTLKYIYRYRTSFEMELGAIVEAIEWDTKEEWEGSDFAIALSGNAAFSYMPSSTSIQDRFSLGVIWTSGNVNKTLQPFNPITTETQGQVLEARLSGLMRLLVSYKARLTDTFSFDLSAYYFINTNIKKDMEQRISTGNEDAIVRGKALVGLEAYAQGRWSPVSDLTLTVGGGAFMPQTGNAFSSGESLRWEASLGVLFSFL